MHLKNNTWTPAAREEHEQGHMIKGDIFTALGTFDRAEHQCRDRDRLSLLAGLKIQGGVRRPNDDDGGESMVAEITKVTSGSIADNSGQLQIGTFSSAASGVRLTMLVSSGDQVSEWNGQKLTNLNYNDVYRIISQHSMHSPDIHMVVRRPLR